MSDMVVDLAEDVQPAVSTVKRKSAGNGFSAAKKKAPELVPFLEGGDVFRCFFHASPD